MTVSKSDANQPFPFDTLGGRGIGLLELVVTENSLLESHSVTFSTLYSWWVDLPTFFEKR
jgi:hypothetical protein